MPRNGRSKQRPAEAGKKLGKDSLNASLAWMEYLAATTDDAKKESFRKLANMVTPQNNGHALTLFITVYEADKNVLKYLPGSHPLKKIKSVLEIYQKTTPESQGTLRFWDYLDPSHLCFIYKNIETRGFKKKLEGFPDHKLKYLSDNYPKYQHRIKELALELTNDYQGPFWAHLAVENGANEGCALLAECYSQKILRLTSDGRSSPQEDIDFLEYYASRIHRESSFMNKDTMLSFLHLGDIFLNKRDNIKARRYLQLAADRGSSRAQLNYALMLEKEVGEKNLFAARQYYKLAAAQGYPEAQSNYAYMLCYGKGGEKNLPEALIYYKMAVDQGLLHAQAGYALMLEEEGGEANLSKALKYYKMAADKGDPEAQYNYAKMLYAEGGEKNLFEVRKYCKMAVDQGFLQAIMSLNYLNRPENNSSSDLCDNGPIATEQDLEDDMKLTLDPLEEGSDSSDEDSITTPTRFCRIC